MRNCIKCNQDRPLRSFSFKDKKAGRRSTVCNRCVYARRKKDPDFMARKRMYDRKRMYGISKKDYEGLIKSQDDRCGICRKEFASSPNIDHDHNTGLIRGLLCTNCNTGLGKLGDSKEGIQRALDYLSISPYITTNTIIGYNTK